MQYVGILVADAARARIYTFEELAAPPGHPTQELRECVDLINPERRSRPSDLLSETRPGADRTPSGRVHAVSDRREGHMRDLDRRFAADMTDAIHRLIREEGLHRLLLVASPRMLGYLREALEPLVRSGITVEHLERNLTRLSTPQLQDHLAGAGLLPARERLGAAS